MAEKQEGSEEQQPAFHLTFTAHPGCEPVDPPSTPTMKFLIIYT